MVDIPSMMSTISPHFPTDQETTDDSTPPVTTATRDETIHIHLGSNFRPVSFEWMRYD